MRRDQGLSDTPSGQRQSGVAGGVARPGHVLDMYCHLRRVNVHEDPRDGETVQERCDAGEREPIARPFGSWYGPPATRADHDRWARDRERNASGESFIWRQRRPRRSPRIGGGWSTRLVSWWSFLSNPPEESLRRLRRWATHRVAVPQPDRPRECEEIRTNCTPLEPTPFRIAGGNG